MQKAEEEKIYVMDAIKFFPLAQVFCEEYKDLRLCFVLK